VDEYQDWLKEKEKEYQKLNEHIQSVCLKNKLNTQLPVKLKDFMVEKKHKIAYCRNAKAGTTTWMQHFNALLDPEHQPRIPYLRKEDRVVPKKGKKIDLHNFMPRRFSVHKQTGMKFNFESLKKYFSDNEYLTFSFVRHPFDRIVSAYKDKAEEKGKEYELKTKSD
jgi:hypothetical protein